jgi:hypothetical protein
MKKRILLIVTALFLLIQSTAYADVIFEPEDSFYRRNQEMMVYLGRSFVANGSGGTVPIMSEPASNRTVSDWQNGDEVFVSFTCLFDGDYWGYTEYARRGGNWLGGWVKMEQLFGSHTFEQQNRGAFSAYNGDYGEIIAAGSAYVWNWPGTDVAPWLLEDVDMTMFSVGSIYTDGEGREWGQIGYYFGRMEGWVCLDEPMNNDIPAFNPTPAPTHESQSWTPQTAHTEIPPAALPVIVIITVLVAVTAIGTAVLLSRLHKRAEKTRVTEVADNG